MPLPQRAPVTGRACLILGINETAYVVRRLTPHPEVAELAWRLRKILEDGSTSNDFYDVCQDETGRHCTCPDFIWCREHKDRKGCKHVAALVAVGLLGG